MKYDYHVAKEPLKFIDVRAEPEEGQKEGKPLGYRTGELFSIYLESGHEIVSIAVEDGDAVAVLRRLRPQNFGPKASAKG